MGKKHNYCGSRLGEVVCALAKQLGKAGCLFAFIGRGNIQVRSMSSMALQDENQKSYPWVTVGELKAEPVNIWLFIALYEMQSLPQTPPWLRNAMA